MNSRLTRSAFLIPAILVALLPLTGLGLWLAIPLVINHGLFMMGAAGLLNVPRGESFGTSLRLRLGPVLLVLSCLALPGVLMLGVPLMMMMDGARGFFTAIAAVSIVAYLGLTLPFWLTYPLTATWRRALRRYVDWLSPAKRAATLASDYTLKSPTRLLVALPVLLAFWGLCGMLWWILDGRLDPQSRFQATLLYALVVAPAVHVAIAAYSRMLFGAHDSVARPSPPEELRQRPVGALRAPGAEDKQRALLDAIRAKQITSVERLIELGADVNASVVGPNGDDMTPLVEASRGGQEAVVRMLLNAGADANRRAGGTCALHVAAESGSAETVRLLLDGGAQPSVSDGAGFTALHYAAIADAPSVVDVLSEFRANVEALDPRHLTPLGLACQRASWAAANALLLAGADIHTGEGHLPLYEAAGISGDDPRGVELLMERGADPGRAGRLGRTPLMAAALAGNSRIADMLLRAGADVDARDQFGISALMEAVRAGANGVLENAVFWNPDTEFKDKPGRTALLVAVASRKANVETVQRLLHMGANPLARNRDGVLASEVARIHGRDEIAQILRQAERAAGNGEPTPEPSPEPTAEHAQPLKRTVDVSAAAPPHSNTAELEDASFTPPPPGPEPTIERESTPATSSMQHAEPTAPTAATTPSVGHGLVKDVASRLAEAAEADDLVACAQILDEYGNLPKATMRVAFLKAAAAGAELVPAVLLDEGLDANDQGDGGTPLLGLVSRMSPPPLRTIQALVERGAALDPASDAEVSPLIAWLRNTPSALGGSAETDDDGQRALAELVGAAGKAGLDPDVRDESGRLALSWAIELHSANVIDALLGAGADPNKADSGGETPLMEACRSGRADAANLVRLLARHGGDPHLKGANDTSAFRVAMQSGDQTLLTFLMAGSGGRSTESASLISAVQEGDIQRVAQLLDAGLDIDGTDADGRTPLHHAAAAGHYRLVEKLVRIGASVDARAQDSTTPLGAAAEAGHTDVVRLLKLAGADVSRPQGLGRTPLIVSSRLWDSAMVHLLLELGADSGERDRAEGTALMAAVQALLDREMTPQAEATVRVLLDAGADPNALNDDRQSALMLLAGIRSTAVNPKLSRGLADVAQTLINAGAEVNARDVSDWTPLHAAAAIGLREVAEALLEAGADTEALDINGNMPSDIALERGHDAIATLLTEPTESRRASP